MALLKALCWALIFIIRIRFPPGTSLAMKLRGQLTRAVLKTFSTEMGGGGVYIYAKMSGQKYDCIPRHIKYLDTEIQDYGPIYKRNLLLEITFTHLVLILNILY